MKSIILKAQRRVERKERIKGVDFIVALSPYFFPERLECGYEEGTGSLLIRFKYLDDETGADIPSPDPLVALEVGKNTGRLLTVRVQVDKHDLDQIQMLVTDEVPKAIESARKRNTDPDIGESFKLAEEAIREHKKEIAEEVGV